MSEGTVEAVECVEVQLITGYPSRDDIRFGDTSPRGPYMLVRVSEQESFVKAIRIYLSRSGKASRVSSINVRSAGLKKASDIPQGQAAIDHFKEFLRNERNW